MPPTLCIVIVSFNARGELERCLASLHAPAPALVHEIVVVDNASTDGSAASARRWPDVRVIESAANIGFARANNIGIRAGAAPFLLLLNPDTIVPAGAVDRLVDYLVAHPDAAVVGPRLVDSEGRAELSFGRMIGPVNEWRQKRLVVGNARADLRASAIVDQMTRREQTPDWVSGACLLVRRADAEAVGLFDERFELYTEDVDFCASIRRRGRLVRFTPDVEIVHARGRSAAATPRAAADAYRRSRLAFYDKHHPLWAPVLRMYLRVTGR